jgi:predicted AAA+ superfamily ATPase
LFENYLASELMKFIRTNRLENKLYFYRTRSGMEVDFIVTTNNGILGIEVKNRDTVIPSDFTNLKKLAEASGKDWSGGLVIYRGNKIQQFGTGLWAIPSTRLLS